MPYAASIAQRRADREPHGIEDLLGKAAWQRLPEAVRTRFSEPAVAVDYVGEFEIVRASPLGRFLAWLYLLIGTPVVPRTGVHVPAVVRVGPTKRGVARNRECCSTEAAQATGMGVVEAGFTFRFRQLNQALANLQSQCNSRRQVGMIDGIESRRRLRPCRNEGDTKN